MKYKINEIFLSLQGEGYNQGKKVIFLRFAKCNLDCWFCDTDFENGTDMTIEEIVTELRKFDCNAVLLTGGEPTIYQITPLLEELKSNGYWTGIETNGIESLSQYRNLLDYITISPKQHYTAQKTNELRVVNQNIGINQILEYEKLFEADNYFLSPVEVNGEMNILNTMELIGLVNEKSNKHWKISLQLHKLVNIR